MIKKKNNSAKKVKNDAYISKAGIIEHQPITNTLRENYMPYAMSVIVSRALPEIDGFKPSHRKLLYTMYKMGLLTGAKTKSANIVGQTMRLNPHGDAAIYETMVRLSRGYEALLIPYVDSKGNFGKSYSKDMAYAASRYTEAKLAPVCLEIFKDIDKDTVDFIPNYDNSTTEPTLLPTTFPTVLVNSNVGIAVSMASNICSFNLKEVCETTISMIKNPDHDICETLQGPDFPGGGYFLYDKTEIQKAIDSGRASFKIRAKYNYIKEENCIEITQIPPTTTVEAIIDKILELIKNNKIREISDLRDETDLSGLKLTLDLKRGVDAEKLMKKLFKSTPLQDSYPCNFNILISGYPKVMGIREIISEWIAFRVQCVKRRIFFDLSKKKEKLHLLNGLERILLDIDKAIKIVRETAEEAEVIPNLMIGFGIDEIQAEYVAEIKLRHLNKEYILKRTKEIEDLLKDIAEMEDILKAPHKVNNIIINELKEIIAKYAEPRKTLFIYTDDIDDEDDIEEIPDYNVNIFLSKEGYFKKITTQSLRMSNEQKLKEGDEIIFEKEVSNNTHLLFFTDKCQVYKSKVSEFDEQKASILGDYIPAKLSFDSDEKVIFMLDTSDYKGHFLFFYDNGKVAKIPVNSYETKTNRKKLANAYCDKQKLLNIFYINEDKEFVITSNIKRKLLFSSAMINEKTTKNSIGVSVFTLKKNQFIEEIELFDENKLANPHRFRTKTVPAMGAIVRPEDEGEQLML